MIRWVGKVVLTAALAGLPLAAAAHSKASPAGKTNVWQAGDHAVWLVPCKDTGDAEEGSVSVQARTRGASITGEGCYPAAKFVEPVWTRRPAGPGPDVILLGQDLGSAGCADVIAVIFTPRPAMQTLHNCPAELTQVIDVQGRPTFNAALLIYFNAAANADTRAGEIVVTADRDGFHAAIPLMIAPPSSSAGMAEAGRTLRTELRAWADQRRADTPDTVELLLKLIMTGHADEAHRLLIEAGHEAVGDRFKAEAFWDDLCAQIIHQPLWTRFELDRLPHADQVKSAAANGQQERPTHRDAYLTTP